MKFAKLSLATVLALGSSAYALELENIKVSGQATLYYQTQDDTSITGDTDKSLFHQNNSKANAGLSIKFASDLGNGFGFGARLNVLDTLGLEHNLVLKPMQTVGDEKWYFGEAYLTKKMGKTLLKAGRQELDTPLLFSEKWNVMPTTFNSVVAINSDIDNVTLIGAYVGKSNTHGSLDDFNTLVDVNGSIQQLAKDGAYAVAGLYGKDNTKAGVWFYNVPTVANAVWADVSMTIDDLKVTGQFAMMMPDKDGLQKHLGNKDLKTDDTFAFALKTGYKVAKDTSVCVAVSNTSGSKDKLQLNVANLGTFKNNKPELIVGGIKTKLATATISGDGDVAGATDTTAYKIKVVQNLGEYGKLIGQFAQYMHGADASNDHKDETATVFEALYKQKVGGVNVLGAYIYDQNVQGWTKAKDDATHSVRIVLNYKF